MGNLFHDFSKVAPTLNIQRSVFKRDNMLKTSFNLGTVFPIYYDEMLPGDTFKVDMSAVIRMTTLERPIMDNINFDTYFFFVPYRIVWEHWKEFNGENNTGPWAQPTTYTIPQVKAPADTGWTQHSLADYFSLPLNVPNLSVSALPFRAYTKIMNDWFRSEVYETPLFEYLGDSTQQATASTTDLMKPLLGTGCFTASKFFDYFTSCLPAPQKGDPVTMTIGEIPVLNLAKQNDIVTNAPVHFVNSDGSAFSSDINTNSYLGLSVSDGSPSGYLSVRANAAPSSASGLSALSINNLWTKSGEAIFSINQLRTAFQLQKILEKMARGGTRYNEIIKSFFGVTVPDFRLQRSEYLGGWRRGVNIQSVVQTSDSTSQNTPAGNLTAYSHTAHKGHMFTYSAQEHGIVIGVGVARQEHTYSQGVEKFWTRKRMFDFYNPTLANLPEQPVYKSELFVNNASQVNTSVFGYQEAWAEYRYKQSRLTGMLRVDQGDLGLENWSIGDYYSSAPALASSFMKENPTFLDRALTLGSDTVDQFVADFYFENISSRPMPVYSVPGLIDHN